MIPRFDYSFSFGDAWRAIKSLFLKERSNAAYYNALFSTSTVYEIGSARLGIKYALQAFQLKPNARIGVQPYTCSSVLYAIVNAECSPVFIDINHTLTLDCDDLEKKIEDLDALIVTHTFGIPADINRIKTIVKNRPVIEDCAHAFHCRYDNKQLGSFFDAAVFSFGNGKFPALGSGGLLVVNNKRYNNNIAEKLERLPNPSILNELNFIFHQFSYSLIYSRLGYQLMYSLFNTYFSARGKQCSNSLTRETLLYKSLKYMFNLKAENIYALAMKQRQNALRIIEKNNSLFEIIYNEDEESNCFTIVLLCENQEGLYRYLIQNGIGAGKHFYHSASWVSEFGYEISSCPNFENLVKKIITIPCFYSLSKKDLSKINTSLGSYTKNYSYESNKVSIL
jgi:perosamine synthetase